MAPMITGCHAAALLRLPFGHSGDTSARVPPSDTSLKGLTIGEYEVGDLLGKGGMGEVYQGRQPIIGKKVAVKVLKKAPGLGGDAAERFLAEARAVNAVGHRAIVDIFSFGKLPDGRPYFVMELLQGEPLNRYLKQKGRLPVDEVIQLLQEIFDALDAVHRAGIVHRDLKPANLFLAKQPNGTRYLKVLDFGIAKVAYPGRKQTMPHLALGTPQYMAPEQLTGDVSPAIDLWATGCLAWVMLMAEMPFPRSFGHRCCAATSEGPRPSTSCGGKCRRRSPT
jgi:serine/threonine protein kinase